MIENLDQTDLDPTDPAVLGIEPFNARSIILSALLGSHPPVLPARAVVAFAELFGIRPGTIRTSLSRMVGAGDLETEDANYRLTGRLLERQHEQDQGRRPADPDWDGSWWTVVVESDRRSVAERRLFRTSMQGARMGELRPDIWLRPANSPPPPRAPEVLITRGAIDGDDIDDLVRRLWDLDEIEAQAQRLIRALETLRPTIASADDDALAAAFVVSAAAVRFLRVEPQLPEQLAPDPWAAPTVRRLYDDFLQVFAPRLRRFYADARRSATP